MKRRTLMDQESKEKHSKRIHQKESHVKKQAKIAKQLGINEKQPHRFAKHNPANCGNPKCLMCGNPRKTLKELTVQEQRQQQDLEAVRDKHSNGLKPDEIQVYLDVRNGTQ